MARVNVRVRVWVWVRVRLRLRLRVRVRVRVGSTRGPAGSARASGATASGWRVGSVKRRASSRS